MARACPAETSAGGRLGTSAQNPAPATATPPSSAAVSGLPPACRHLGMQAGPERRERAPLRLAHTAGPSITGPLCATDSGFSLHPAIPAPCAALRREAPSAGLGMAEASSRRTRDEPPRRARRGTAHAWRSAWGCMGPCPRLTAPWCWTSWCNARRPGRLPRVLTSSAPGSKKPSRLLENTAFLEQYAPHLAAPAAATSRWAFERGPCNRGSGTVGPAPRLER